ncbi:PucR family transcriptional regulator [Arthrobacter cheniae]|uniref:PucR family transcriptional regulator n=1 Tax=Arthrobacter cheniae TaxID=1258888 RepID=A0A3A5M8V1_9MICC|nr:PucR family transcriptional regulator [Arthrobacter cheniae]RJT78057.1 PucR family transcriptional regulator [Arthrobacter cheniae]
MIVADLLAADTLQLRLHTPSSADRLGWDISWCAPAETIDPTPFLSDNVLLLTNGIGLNIEDQRTWTAYVERLVRVRVAAIAFGTGTAHRLIPPGLVRAASALDVPLLEIPRSVPFLQVHRHVTNVLQVERYTAINRSWELAQECAQLAASGSHLQVILDAAAQTVEGDLAIVDAAGAVIARSPAAATWSESDLADVPVEAGHGSIPLPMGTGDSFQLIVRNAVSDHPASTLLAPAASIIAVQLQTALHTTTHKERELEVLLDQVPDWAGVALEEFTASFRATGLDVHGPTLVLAATTGRRNLANAWRIRLLLQARFGDVRVQLRSGILYAFAQGPLDGVGPDRAAEQFLTACVRDLPDQALVVKGPCHTIDELRLGIHQAGTMVGTVRKPQRAPDLGIRALIASTASSGARVAAHKLLAPVIAYDEVHSIDLVRTLEAFLGNDAQPGRTAASLFIHRNTLAQRLAKLEGLLHLSLTSLEGQATCLMALQILRSQASPAL